ncbi:MAG: peroxiredoxin family protein [Acidobacteriaceae bacterium]
MEAPRFRSHKIHWLARLQLRKTTRFVLAVICALSVGALAFAKTPAVGANAPDFTLSTPTGGAVRMSRVQWGHDLVLVILRGFPGYQCPYCVRQVHDFIDHAPEFKEKNTRILLVYPGPSGDLDQHAREFLAKQTELPPNVVLVTDPDYAVTNQYGLRWDAPHETAYPSTFILNGKGIIVFEKISHTHGDRLSAEDALEHLPAK